jgi:hypothetical protein
MVLPGFSDAPRPCFWGRPVAAPVLRLVLLFGALSASRGDDPSRHGEPVAQGVECR